MQEKIIFSRRPPVRIKRRSVLTERTLVIAEELKRAAYHEAESKLKPRIDTSRANHEIYLSLAPLMRRMGDIYAKSPPEDASVNESGRTRLLEALKRYERSVELYSTYKEQVPLNLRHEIGLTLAKLEACKRKLGKT